jgi:hypothetical protein
LFHKGVEARRKRERERERERSAGKGKRLLGGADQMATGCGQCYVLCIAVLSSGK